MIDKMSGITPVFGTILPTTATDTAYGSQLDNMADAATVKVAAYRVKVTNALDDAINDAQKDKKEKYSDDKVRAMTDKLNKNMNDMNLQLKFVWYKELDRLGVRMIDINTQKVIKSFPPEDVMNTLIKTKEWIGKFLDENV